MAFMENSGNQFWLLFKILVKGDLNGFNFEIICEQYLPVFNGYVYSRRFKSTMFKRRNRQILEPFWNEDCDFSFVHSDAKNHRFVQFLIFQISRMANVNSKMYPQKCGVFISLWKYIHFSNITFLCVNKIRTHENKSILAYRWKLKYAL